MSERSSTLTQRVRRLLGTAELIAPSAIVDLPPRGETAALFEARIAKLSHVLDELRAVDLQREAELHALREQILIVRDQARLELAQTVAAAMREIDDLIRLGRGLLSPEELPATTPFERMRLRAAAQRPASPHHEMLATFVVHLSALRARLADLADE